ncbi:Gamma-glutamyltranspeptidase [Lentisphaera araneosa HTCC2155]|uniref:Glutathione hydrolase proenzyme n=1 Tax=Lentisphaera araneosa HTCC2155 TaxID=313628 RepID=A6DLS2_9BACT|nr:gamma-glutamyltransferase [Lentisphaera araneosa]EDM27527.1 Gamma-glutamyltranspeptidase [Lentisphaera araneosa HTCC2155]
MPLKTSSFFFCFTFLFYGLIHADSSSYATRPVVKAKNGMLATSHPLATKIGLQIIKDGGNAIDAAIAANAALGLMEPTGGGIGGDLFAIVWSAKDKKLYGLNASGRSPQLLTWDYFREHNLNRVPYSGPLPVTVPGCVDGWFELHGKFGKLPMKEILAPAIKYCREGFELTPIIARHWSYGDDLIKQPNFASTFFPNGRSPKEGESFKNPDLGNTLEIIAQEGRDAFYKGSLAKRMDAFSKKHGHFLRYEDLASHKSLWVEPLKSNYRGYDIWELPPNTQGIAALQMLNILEKYELRSWGHNSAKTLHHMVEAKKLSYEDRTKYYADPQLSPAPLKGLISKEYADARRQLINSEKVSEHFEPGNPILQNGDTVYLSVGDKEGNMISFIQSNYAGFGSGVVPDGMGFSFQDRGALFNIRDKNHPNAYAPGKLPFHTIIPAFITKDGAPWLSFGLMGGAMQPQGHVQIVCNLIDFDMNLQEACDAPRFRHYGSSTSTGYKMSDSGTLRLEKGVSSESIEKLRSMGHDVRPNSRSGFGGFQGVIWDKENKTYIGASESRKDGHAEGY